MVHFIDTNVIHKGDTYFDKRNLFIDSQHSGSIDGVIKIADKVIVMGGPKTKIITGHGPLSNKAELIVCRDMFQNTGKRLAVVVGGKNCMIFYAANPTAEFDADWGNGFLKWKKFLELIYTGIKN